MSKTKATLKIALNPFKNMIKNQTTFTPARNFK
jgi:hypothetical protein